MDKNIKLLYDCIDNNGKKYLLTGAMDSINMIIELIGRCSVDVDYQFTSAVELEMNKLEEMYFKIPKED